MTPEERRVDAIAAEATEQFLQRQADQFLECAINLMATTRPLAEVASRLRDHAEMLEEYG